MGGEIRNSFLQVATVYKFYLKFINNSPSD